MMVRREKRLMLLRVSFFSPPVMSFFENTLRLWKVMLLPMAAPKPAQLKDASVAEARPTPPTMGSRERITGMLGVSPRKADDIATEKKGSIALIVCVNDTATLPKLTFVSRFPSKCCIRERDPHKHVRACNRERERRLMVVRGHTGYCHAQLLSKPASPIRLPQVLTV